MPLRGVSLAALLALASCSSSSSGNGDASGTGGAASGSGAPDAATSGGGGSTGGGSYGGGGAGGTPSVCSDPAYPQMCPMRGEVPAICWSAGTACSTIVKCGDQFRSCNSPTATYDCASNACVVSGSTEDGGTSSCAEPYPRFCPGKGDVPAICWSKNTVCSTIGRCGNDFKSCELAGFHFSCGDNKCVADTATDAGATPADATVDSSSATHD